MQVTTLPALWVGLSVWGFSCCWGHQCDGQCDAMSNGGGCPDRARGGLHLPFPFAASPTVVCPRGCTRLFETKAARRHLEHSLGVGEVRRAERSVGRVQGASRGYEVSARVQQQSSSPGGRPLPLFCAFLVPQPAGAEGHLCPGCTPPRRTRKEEALQQQQRGDRMVYEYKGVDGLEKHLKDKSYVTGYV